MKENKGLEAIVKGYCEWTGKTSEYPSIDYYCLPGKTAETYYQTAISLVKDLKYEKEDINEFCKLIGGDKKRIIGLYLSALVNNVIKENEKITLQPNIILDCLGYKHSKGTLIIEGNTGNLTGMMMTNGMLIVKGNAKYGTCYCMTGGKIVIEGKMLSIAYDIEGEVWEYGRRIHPPRPLLRSLFENWTLLTKEIIEEAVS